MTKRIQWIALIIALAGLAGYSSAGSQRSASSAAQQEHRGWTKGGARRSLASIEGRGAAALPGSFSVLCSAKRAQALALFADTLWIGTEGGLFAYCISEDTVVADPGPAFLAVTALSVGDDGTLWVGGESGISVRRGGAWSHYTTDREPLLGRVRRIVQGEGKVWIATYGNGCGYIMNGTLTMLSRRDSLPDDRVLGIAEESSIVIWFGTASGLVMADSTEWRSLRFGSRIPLGAVKDLLFDEQGSMFLALAGQGVVQYSMGRVRTFAEGDGALTRSVNVLSLDERGRVWAAGDGWVSVFDGSSWSRNAVAGAVSRASRYLSIIHDTEGTCYIGTDAGSIIVLSRGGTNEVVIPQRFPASRVARVRSAGGALWFLTGSSVVRFRDRSEEIAPPGDWFRGEMTDISVDDAGDLWIATRFGALHRAGRSWDTFDRRQDLPTENMTSIARHPRGEIWLGTFDAGVIHGAGGRWAPTGEAEGLPGRRITGLIVDGEGIPWVATAGGRIARWVSDAWEEIELPAEAKPIARDTMAADSLPLLDPAIRYLPEAGGGREGNGSVSVLAIGVGKPGSCMIATNRAVCRFTQKGWQVIGLPPAYRRIVPTAVTSSSSGEVWLGTAGDGVLLYRGGEWSRLGISRGIGDSFVLDIAEDRQGIIWIGTQSGGVTRFARRP